MVPPGRVVFFVENVTAARRGRAARWLHSLVVSVGVHSPGASSVLQGDWKNEDFATGRALTGEGEFVLLTACLSEVRGGREEYATQGRGEEVAKSEQGEKVTTLVEVSMWF